MTTAVAVFGSVKAPPKVLPRFAKPIKAMIEDNPSFGYRTVAHLLGLNKNTVQRVFQLRGWQVRKRLVGFRLRIEARRPRASQPNENAGRRIYAVFGRAMMAGRRWHQ